jgi:acetate kinase
MEWCGLRLDQRLNNSMAGPDRDISAQEASLKAYVIHTDEEAIIARETARLIEGRS